MARKFLMTALISAVAVLGAACGGSDDSAEPAAQKKKIALRVAYFGAQANTYLNAQIQQLRAMGKELGFELTVFDSGFDPQKQYNQIQDATTQKRFNVFIVAPVNGPALVPVLARTDAAGIKVVAISGSLETDLSNPTPKNQKITAQVLVPPGTRGTWLGEQMVGACEGIDPCKVASVAGIAALPSEQAISKNFKEVIKDHPNIKLVADADGAAYTEAGGLKTTQDILSAHPDLNVLAMADQSVFGAMIAIKKAGKTYGIDASSVRLLGIGGGSRAIAEVNAGRWFSTQAGFPRDEARLGLNYAIQALEGKLTHPAGANPVLVRKLPGVLTKESIADSGVVGQFAI